MKTPKISTYSLTDLTEQQQAAIFTLLHKIWPKEAKSVEELVANHIAQKNRLARERPDYLRYVIWADGKAIAHAETFARDILSSAGTHKILALASVCTEPKRAGEGLGAAVCRAAFERVDDGMFPVSLFQTGVAEFYEKLGCRVIDNTFINSKNEANPEENPWRYSPIMIYPADFDWPEGTIDLNGADY